MERFWGFIRFPLFGIQLTLKLCHITHLLHFLFQFCVLFSTHEIKWLFWLHYWHYCAWSSQTQQALTWFLRLKNLILILGVFFEGRLLRLLCCSHITRPISICHSFTFGIFFRLPHMWNIIIFFLNLLDDHGYRNWESFKPYRLYLRNNLQRIHLFLNFDTIPPIFCLFLATIFTVNVWVRILTLFFFFAIWFFQFVDFIKICVCSHQLTFKTVVFGNNLTFLTLIRNSWWLFVEFVQI